MMMMMIIIDDDDDNIECGKKGGYLQRIHMHTEFFFVLFYQKLKKKHYIENF